MLKTQVANRIEGGDPAAPPSVFVTESDDYSKTIRGIDIRVIRASGEPSPTEIRSSTAADCVAVSTRIGSSVLSRAVIPDDQIAVGVIEHAPPRARWCGVDLKRGDVVVYGPGAEHIGINPTGMRFSFAVISTEDLARTFDRLEVESKVPAGSVERMLPSVATQRVHGLVRRLPTLAPRTDATPALRNPELLTAISDLLAMPQSDRPVCRRLNDSRIVLECIERAERDQRIPTTDELCAAAHVSERRMREAFHVTQDMAPHAFFLTWGLDRARRRLIASDPKAVTVAWVACGAGFTHLGRFARYYKQLYGESPSVTLRRDPSQCESV